MFNFFLCPKKITWHHKKTDFFSLERQAETDRLTDRQRLTETEAKSKDTQSRTDRETEIDKDREVKVYSIIF